MPHKGIARMERIELPLAGLEAAVLPLDHIRISRFEALAALLLNSVYDPPT